MAFATTTQWDVRTTGNAANGGGFDVASSGTDYSQQDSPQVTYTDLVIDGATNTKCTSAGNPFTSAHVGNIINITSGTGFTVQRVQVVSVAAGVATCDKSLGTLGSTGGNGKLGGSLLTVAAALSLAPASNNNTGVIHIKAGTYTVTSAITTSNNQWIHFSGYSSTHGDFGTRPLITTSTNSIVLMALQGTGGIIASVSNVSFSSTAGTKFAAVSTANSSSIHFDNCVFDSCNQGVFSTATGTTVLTNCEVKNSVLNGIDCTGANGLLKLYGCYIHDNGGHGVSAPSIIADLTVIANNVSAGVTAASNAWYGNCTVAFNGTAGIINSGSNVIMCVVSCILYGNDTYGISNTGSVFICTQQYNAFGDNTTANRNGLTSTVFTVVGDVSLTASPFVSTTDFRLNSTNGGGVLCRGLGYPGTFPGGAFIGYSDLGAVQHQDAPHVINRNVVNFVVNEGDLQ